MKDHHIRQTIKQIEACTNKVTIFFYGQNRDGNLILVMQVRGGGGGNAK